MDHSIVKRFWQKVTINGKDACWEWKAHTRRHYGTLQVDGKGQYAHRLSWQIANGIIPSNMYVLHKCDNPLCVNPDHLFLGTQKENMQDCVTKGRYVSRVTMAKLTDSTVQSICDEYATGKLTQKVIALKYGVAQTTVSAVVRKKSWQKIK